ncbi:MAG: 50S ribosomal protein L6 [Syntrophales bacterium]|jgi:large subunit ribosomal protein L6
MSRIGKKSVLLPDKVHLVIDNETVKVEGPKGMLSMKIPHGIGVSVDKDSVTVTKGSDDRTTDAYHGLVRTLVANMVTGVSTGFVKSLEIVGVGYRAEVAGSTLKLIVGYSSPVEYKIPGGITIKVDKQVNIAVSGIDKEKVGRVAAEIRALKKPEPYKGKGIRLTGEYVRRKVGKSVGTK